MPELTVERFGDRHLLVRIEEYSPRITQKLSKVPGGNFVSGQKGGPGWRFKLDMQNCTLMRELFGDSVQFQEDVLAWGREEKERELYLTSLAAAEDQQRSLTTVQEYNPEMYAKLRNYQRIGIQFVAESDNPLVADDPGIGKTWEVIGGVIEAGLHEGPNLVICPKISIESVWQMELDRWVDEPVFLAPEGKRQRRNLLKEVELCQEEGIPFWLVVNPAMVSLRRSAKGTQYDHVTGARLEQQFPFLFEVEWNTVIIDEAHEAGIANPSSQLSRAMSLTNSKKRIAMTGTPMGGKPLRLWGILHWLEPKRFSSKHEWAKRWVDEKELRLQDGRRIKTYGDIQGDREEAFYKEHRRYIIRRKKSEVFRELPDKQPVDIWVYMTPAQQRQYELMEQEAYALIYEGEQATGQISMPNVLATNSWLKQFANAFCELEEKGKVWNDLTDEWDMKYRAKPTLDSPKIEAVMEIMSQVGADDKTTGEQVVIFTQFRAMADLLTEHLRSKGLSTAKITGDVTRRDERAKIQEDFQAGGVYQAIVMTTKAGGVSINLDQANTVIFVDETWNPDDQTQASDRCHRASRIHRVTVYTLRTRGSIEEDVFQRIKEKTNINEILLDRYRQRAESGELS